MKIKNLFSLILLALSIATPTALVAQSNGQASFSPWAIYSGTVMQPKGSLWTVGSSTTPVYRGYFDQAQTNTLLSTFGTVLTSDTIGTVTGTPTATLDYGNGDPWVANGYSNAVRVYAYKDVIGLGRVYSSTYAQSAIYIDNNSSDTIVFTWTWNAVAGATGYIVERYNTGPNPSGPSPMAYDYYVDVGGTNSYSDFGDEWGPLTITVFNPTLKSYDVSQDVNGALAFGSNRQTDQSEFKVPILTIGTPGDSQKHLTYSGGYLNFLNDDATRTTINANIVAGSVQASTFSGGTFSGTHTGTFNLNGAVNKVVVTGPTGNMVGTGVDFRHYTGPVGSVLSIGGGKTSFVTGDDTARLWLNLATGSSVLEQFTNNTTGNANASGTIAGINVNGGYFISNRMATSTGFSTLTFQNQVALTGGALGYSPLVFTSNGLAGTPVAGGMEFLTDKYYGTITTGAARKEFTLNDATLTSGTVPVATTNGRITNGYTSLQKRSIFINVKDAKLPASNPARIDASEQNWRLLFDATTSQSALWDFVMPQDYGSGLAVRLMYTMNLTQSGTNNVLWRTYIMADTPGDAEDINTNGFSSANLATSTLANNQTAGYIVTSTSTMTNNDSLAAGDFVQFQVDRNAANGGDTGNGDAELTGILLEYTSL